MPKFGPSHQQPPRRNHLPRVINTRRRLLFTLSVVAAVVGLSSYASDHALGNALFVLGVLGLVGWIGWMISGRTGARMPRFAHRLPAAVPATDPVAGVEMVRRKTRELAGGVYLGLTDRRQVMLAMPENAVLVLGPPRSGKSSAVIIPSVIAHDGPVVSTSTKPDVAAATQGVRGQDGTVWVFDPTGTGTGTGRGPGASEPLRWSPVTASAAWNEALLMARSMTSPVGEGTTDRTHWSNRAQALLAPMLHAAAIHDRPMSDVLSWVMRHDLNTPGALLEDERCAQQAFDSLTGIAQTEDRERSSIFSATADGLLAYQSQPALDAATDPNFDAAAFVRSQDTVYIHAPADEQAAVAPLVCGLLSEIRRATYRAHAHNQLHGRVLFALDEVANIAPLQDLPQIASEGGGQGLTLLAALQDLSQARHRWGAQADGFLTLFGTKLILRGIADTKTLEAISTTLGEYDRQVVSHSSSPYGAIDWVRGRRRQPSTTTVSTQRTPVLSPGQVSRIPDGHAVEIQSSTWVLLQLTPAHTHEPWQSLTNLPLFPANHA